MHYYKRNIGDYHKKAGKLSLLQHGVYTILIDSIYDREKFPTEEEAIDWVWASSEEEIEALKFVLKKFFEEKEGVYHQSRIKDELDAYHSRCEKNAQIAHERETKRKENNTKRTDYVDDSSPNHKPLNNNHKPLTKDKVAEAPKFNFKNTLIDLGGDIELIDEWLAIRKQKKARNSEHALKTFLTQVDKSNLPLNQILQICCAKQWKGFEAAWIDNMFQGQKPEPGFIENHTDTSWANDL